MLIFGLVMTNGDFSAAVGPEIRGCIKLQNNLGKIPRFRILFDGKETMSNNEGFFSIPLDDSNIKHFSLIICKSVQQNFDQTNTIKNVSIPVKEKYRHFVFSRFGNRDSWDQRENVIKSKKNFVLPPNCVVVLLDPDHVQDVEPWNIALSEDVIKLPALVLKNDTNPHTLATASARSLLESLDTTPFHQPVQEATRNVAHNAKVQVSVMH